ncbi:hypothetical protein MMC13_000218 [Lambiella insularis]|nr:hypothetical protein [Lambiella insularis]
MNPIISSLVCSFLVGFAVCMSYIQRFPNYQHVFSKFCGNFSFLWVTANAFANAKMLQTVHVELLDKNQVMQQYSTDTWQRQAYESLDTTLCNKDRIFPCIYSTRGHKANELDFLFLESEDLSDVEIAKAAAKGIVEYHKGALTRGKNTSLVIIAPPPLVERSVDEYHKLFWSFLLRLRKLDPKPWPQSIPKDTSDQQWCFNFDDTQSFIGVLTPGHRQRLSRYAPNLCLIYQPRYLFDALFSSEKSRNSATKTVRNLVDKYDLIHHSPDISDYALPGTTESRQYFLLDQNETAHCPYASLEVK